VLGGKYLPEPAASRQSAPVVPKRAPGSYRSTFLLLGAIVLAVTVFRGVYEQIGNTLPLWADSGIDRTTVGRTIPMTWFQSLNPLLVFLMTPVLLAVWRRRADAGYEQSSLQKMTIGALLVAAAYLLLAVVAFEAGTSRADWLWLALFFIVFTLGELYILPTGLGLFARLAPIGLGATTMAIWFLAIFSGSLAAGVVGTLWSRMSHALYFAVLATIAGVAATLLYALDGPTRRIEAARDRETSETSGAGGVRPEISLN
jgi:POT family proton-dependent oligopeptide transporter